ncbi:MAG: hypothetical protein A2Z64_12420 [Betaproteobacteria bacterium RIFCSPLOWO2_02_67_12]|nr:MAG: hypothetical protein A2Z64_12420 [Betaproteobacteria bacterium RIFCSPLOWO2_02_67_12]
MTLLRQAEASAFARVALANVAREYPRKLDHLLLAPPGELTPRRIHPVFFGSYDWHSAVHMHWLLARLLRLHPALPEADDIGARLDLQLAPQAMAGELAYFDSPAARTFERPYGWGWLLELLAELTRLKNDPWTRAVAPLAGLIAARFRTQVCAAPYPVRSGSHGNTAFASLLALDYARRAGDHALAAAIEQAAHRWYASDRDAPVAYEPSLDDFLSPALVEATLMREVLPAAAFRVWLGAFLPADLGPLDAPPVVADRSDAKQAHLDGLALSRAWCFVRLAATWPAGDARRAAYQAAAERHFATALPQAVGGDYAGEHWLASFAALAMGECP